jgi:hypothetical protein
LDFIDQNPLVLHAAVVLFGQKKDQHGLVFLGGETSNGSLKQGQ